MSGAFVYDFTSILYCMNEKSVGCFLLWGIDLEAFMCVVLSGSSIIPVLQYFILHRMQYNFVTLEYVHCSHTYEKLLQVVYSVYMKHLFGSSFKKNPLVLMV